MMMYLRFFLTHAVVKQNFKGKQQKSPFETTFCNDSYNYVENITFFWFTFFYSNIKCKKI